MAARFTETFMEKTHNKVLFSKAKRCRAAPFLNKKPIMGTSLEIMQIFFADNYALSNTNYTDKLFRSTILQNTCEMLLLSKILIANNQRRSQVPCRRLSWRALQQ